MEQRAGTRIEAVLKIRTRLLWIEKFIEDEFFVCANKSAIAHGKVKKIVENVVLHKK